MVPYILTYVKRSLARFRMAPAIMPGSTPIINHPEVSILGVHKAREMPVVRNGKIEIRRIMNISSSFDHRIVDGANGAALIQSMKKLLEHPALIFM